MAESDYVVYHWHFYLPNDNDTPLEVINDRLRAAIRPQFADQPSLVKEKRHPTLHPDLIVSGHWGDWSLDLCCKTTPDVAQDAQALAASHAFAPPWDRVATCRRRIELRSAPDFNADEFNTYVGVHAALEEAFQGTIVVDGDSGALMEE